MEVLGAVASALTLVDVVCLSIQGIHRLHSKWKNAPTAVIALEKELEHSRDALSQLSGIIPIISNTPAPQPLTLGLASPASSLSRTVDDLSSILKELESILGCFRETDSKESRFRWLKCQSDVERKKDLLRNSRRSIQEFVQYWQVQQHYATGVQLELLTEDVRTLNALYLCQTLLNKSGETGPSFEPINHEVVPTELSLVLSRLRSLQQTALSHALSRLATSSSPPLGESTSPGTMQEIGMNSDVRLRPDVEMGSISIRSPERMMSASHDHVPSDRLNELSTSPSVQTNAPSTVTISSECTTKPMILSCEPVCECVCHIQIWQSRRGRMELFRHVFGSATLGCINVSTPKTRCNISTCYRAAGGFSMTVRYVFPTWITRRILFSSISSFGLEKHQFTLSTSRRVAYAPGNIFSLINSRDYSGAVGLLQVGSAHIRDIETRHGNSILHATLRHATFRPGFVDFISFLMRNEVNIHLPNNRGETPWLLAAYLMLPNMPATLVPAELKKQLYHLFPWPDWTKLRFTHLHMVVSGLRPLDLRMVLQDRRYKSQVNSRDVLGRTPLALAVMMGNHTAAEDLLAAGANFESCSSDLIRKAIHSRSKFCVELLLKWSANAFALDGRGATLIHTAAAGCDNLDILESLLAAGIGFDEQNFHWCTPLSFTPLHDNHTVARLLLSRGANINNVDKDGDTPLTESVRLNAHVCLRLFIESGANVKVVNKRGWTLLHFAGAYGDASTFEVLSATCLSAEPWMDNNGETPQSLFRRRKFVSMEDSREFEALVSSLRAR